MLSEREHHCHRHPCKVTYVGASLLHFTARLQSGLSARFMNASFQHEDCCPPSQMNMSRPCVADTIG
eukprot:2305589-Amphidinium_carterae.1